MQINVKFGKNFQTALNRMLNDYGTELATLNGLGDEQLSYGDFIDNFIDEATVADSSVDGNANVRRKDIVTLLTEMPKPHRKLIAFNKIFYEMQKAYGFKAANEFLEREWKGELYLHDSDTSTFKSYCFAYDLKDLAEKGLFFLGDNFNPMPPKHLTTFVDFVKEFISFNANRTSGAVGLPNLIPYMYYFWNEDKKKAYLSISDWSKYAEQNIQRFIYAVNQPCIRDNQQSAFTNTSVFDREYLMALFGGAEFPNGELMVDHIEGIMEFQKLYMKIMSNIRSENMFTFPVSTISLIRKNGKFLDEEFAEWAIKHNMKWSDSNFFIDDNVSSLSNCPLSPDTKILYWSDYYNQYKLSPIKDVYNCRSTDNKIPIVKVLSNGQEINCKINKFDIPPEYEITLVNGAKIKTTANHLNKVFGKDYVPTSELTVEDYLPYGIHAYENSDFLTYEEGKIVGAFLGDGSYTDYGIILSLNEDTDRDFMDWLNDYVPHNFGGTCKEDLCMSQLSGKKKCINFRINSLYLKGLIEQCVIGDSALNKKINLKVLNYSKNFRKGIIDGWYQTDGGNNNRIYTSSIDLVESMNIVFMSLGMVTRINEDNRENRLGNNTCYIVRYYNPGIRKRLKDTYIIDNDYMWIKIKSIKRCKTKASTSFCLEVLDDIEPIFTLGNGIITHNCRLKSNIKDLGYCNSIGGTALKVGSIKVNTINLARLALDTNNTGEFLEELKNRTLCCLKVLHVVRHIIKRNVEKGLLPNFSYGLIDFASCYSTIGFIGIFEALKKFGFTYQDKLGNTYYSKEGENFGQEIFKTINKIKTQFIIDNNCDYMINCEQIPAENAAAKLMKKDKFFYPDADIYDLPLYGNQFMPLGIKSTLQERTRVQALFDSFCNGGSIQHANIDAPFKNYETARKMVEYIADQGVTYFAFNTKIQACEDNHAFYGTTCPVCGKPIYTEYTRIVGFLVPIKSWSRERKNEYKLRKWESTEKIEV